MLTNKLLLSYLSLAHWLTLIGYEPSLLLTGAKAARCRRDFGSYTARLAVAILGSQTRVSFIFHLWTFFFFFHSFFS